MGDVKEIRSKTKMQLLGESLAKGEFGKQVACSGPELADQYRSLLTGALGRVPTRVELITFITLTIKQLADALVSIEQKDGRYER